MYQESSLDECSVTEATESEEDEPPLKRAAPPPSKSYIKSTTTYINKTTLKSTAANKDNLSSSSCTRGIRKDNSPLLNIEKLKTLAPVTGITTQTPINTPKRPIILNSMPVTSSPLMEKSSQQFHKVDNLVSIETSNGRHVFFPMTYRKNERLKIIKKYATRNKQSNVNVKQSGMPNLLSDIIIKQNGTQITQNSIIVNENRTPVTQRNIIVKQRKTPV